MMLKTAPGLGHFIASEFKRVAATTTHHPLFVSISAKSPLLSRKVHSSYQSSVPSLRVHSLHSTLSVSKRSRLIFHLLQPKTFVTSAPDFSDSSSSDSSSSSSSDASSRNEAEFSDAAEESEPALSSDTVKPRVQKLDEYGRSYGRGWRKSARAHVYIKPGDGTLYINGKLHSEYFARWAHRGEIISPFKTTQTLTKFDMYATVRGGGHSGQAGAIKLGVARAIAAYHPEYYKVLKAALLLKRDMRKKERKKPGRYKARKSHQWVRR